MTNGDNNSTTRTNEEKKDAPQDPEGYQNNSQKKR